MNTMYFERMKKLLGEEYEAYIESLNQPLYRGLRVNTKKINKDEFKNIGKPSKFCGESFYVEEAMGNHPLHICGCFYLQEPSASSAVEILDVQPSDVVLDLCAAPGGKSTQIASKLTDGFLVSNEIDAKRAQVLLSNMERMGVENMAVTNTTVDKLTSIFDSCFDKILVDAPCSGEGMIKKHDVALENWSIENVQFCAKRQKEILEHAYTMLKKDGILVYSTCTYSIEENEEVVQNFLKNHEDIELMDPQVYFGRKAFFNLDCRRIFPMDGGEGHFIAKFKKKSGKIGKLPVLKSMKMDPIVKQFLNEQLEIKPCYYYVSQDKVFGMNFPFIDFKKIKVLRQGVYIGDIVKKRFEPAHAFYMVAGWKYLKNVNLSLEEMDYFIHGNVLNVESPKGYIAVCYQNYPFGFGKSDGKQIKNKIPKGLRLNPNSKIHL